MILWNDCILNVDEILHITYNENRKEVFILYKNTHSTIIYFVEKNIFDKLWELIREYYE